MGETTSTIFTILLFVAAFLGSGAYAVLSLADFRAARRGFWTTSLCFAAVGLVLGIMTTWPLPVRIGVCAAFFAAAGGGLVWILDYLKLREAIGVAGPIEPPPSPTPPPPIISAPPASFRVVNIEFFPPEADKPTRAKYTIANLGGMAASHILKSPAHAVADSVLTLEQENKIVFLPIPPASEEGGNEFQPGEGGAYWIEMPLVTREIYDHVLAGKLRLYLLIRIIYRDELTPAGKRRLTETCRSYSGSLTEPQWCAGHNRTYLID